MIDGLQNATRPRWSDHLRSLRPRILGITVLFLLMSPAARGQDLRPIASTIAARLAASNHKTLAVVDFTDLEGNVTKLGRFQAEEFSVDLMEDAKGFDVIDRTHLKSLLQ